MFCSDLLWGTLAKLSSPQYEVDVVNDLVREDDSPVGLVTRGKLVEGAEELDDKVNGAVVNVGVDHVDEGSRLSHNIEGLDVVRLVSQVLLYKHNNVQHVYTSL